MSDGKGDVWVEAGFAELARSGVEGVRVEVLAKSLGVTKGGFYRRFADRAALLGAMLQRWREGRAASIAQQTRLDGQEPRDDPAVHGLEIRSGILWYCDAQSGWVANLT